MEIPFPLMGLHEGMAAEKQPPITTSYAKNVRSFDVDKERGRGGQRPGFVIAYTTQIGGEYPVLKMCSIITAYIEPA